MALTLTSPAFKNQGEIPRSHLRRKRSFPSTGLVESA